MHRLGNKNKREELGTTRKGENRHNPNPKEPEGRQAPVTSGANQSSKAANSSRKLKGTLQVLNPRRGKGVLNLRRGKRVLSATLYACLKNLASTTAPMPFPTGWLIGWVVLRRYIDAPKETVCCHQKRPPFDVRFLESEVRRICPCLLPLEQLWHL